MAVKPILFSAPMVRALLEGRKNQTRRVLKPQPEYLSGGLPYTTGGSGRTEGIIPLKHAPGDLLWVREACAEHPEAKGNVFQKNGDGHPWGNPIYKATFGAMLDPVCEGFSAWRSPIHMPRWASRLTLEVTEVRVERVQDISRWDCYREGIQRPRDGYLGSEKTAHDNARIGFSKLWNSLNEKRGYSFESNPWVVATAFKVHHQNVDAFLQSEAA